ncbi:hypothetical protein BH10BAC5_BH10BAC5_19440 [soil metagenome]
METTDHLFLQVNHSLILPDLANKLGIESHEFRIKELFKGGMGICAKIQSMEGDYYALKIIHSNKFEDRRWEKRYIYELKTWLTLSACDGVAEAICLTQINYIPCIVSKWMNNGNLSGIINRKNSTYFYRNVDRIITTLEWVFKNYSIIHRDLKPGNILLDDNYNAYIADWGIAKLIKDSSIETSNNLKNNNSINNLNFTEEGIGTVCYSSPEQIMGDKNIDQRSDMYSLGCIMYQWETGNPPFVGTPKDIYYQHLNSKPKPISGIFKSTNYKIEKIIEKCLEKNPSKRYQTYEELSNDFCKIALKSPLFEKFYITERYKTHIIGENEFDKKLSTGKIQAILGKDCKYSLVEQEEIKSYLDEAMHLTSIGEFKKAKDIFERFYFPDLIIKFPESIYAGVCVSLGFVLQCLGEYKQSIIVLENLKNASFKSATFYVNLSLSYISTFQYERAEATCKDGLKLYNDDIGIIGNLTIALLYQEKLEEALINATKNLQIARTVNSLEEIAGVHNHIGDKLKNTEFPNAIINYKKAVDFLREAIGLNPRFTTARLSLANLLYKLKKYEESSHEASKAVKNTPYDSNIELGVYYVARNMKWDSEYEDCRKFCEDWLVKYPNSTFINRIWAENMVDGYVLGNVKDGIRVIERKSLDFFTKIILNNEKRKSTDFTYLAKIYLWMGDEEKIDNALSVLREGIEIYPNDFRMDFYIAIIFQKLEYFNDAFEAAIIAHKKAPWRESTFNLLSSIYKDLGELEKSKKYENEANKLIEYKNTLYNLGKN